MHIFLKIQSKYRILLFGTALFVVIFGFFSFSANLAKSASVRIAQGGLSLANSGNSTVPQGSSVTNTITAYDTFNSIPGDVSFSAVVSGSPYQVSTSFSPASCNATCSTVLTITTSAFSPGGSYTVTVTGTAGAYSATTSFTLTIQEPINFSLAFDDSPITVVKSGSNVIVDNILRATKISGPSSGSVNFSTFGSLPSGVTASFISSSCDFNAYVICSSIMSLTISPTATAGSYTITARGTGSPGGLVRTASFTLIIQNPFNFSLSNGGNRAVTQAGPTITNPITATLSSGSTQAVSYSVSGLPSGATSLFSPTSCSPNCSTTLSITAGATTPAGNYTITVTGTGGGVTRTTTFTLTVNASFNFSLSNGGNKVVTQGGPTISNTATATLSSGATQAVSFSVSGLLPGPNITFSPTSCNPNCSITLNITADASTPVGDYTITVTGQGGGVTRTTSFVTTVQAPPFNFSLSNGGNKVVTQGGTTISNTATATLSSGSTQAVSFSVSGLLPGPNITFSPTSCNPNCSITLYITADASTPVGNYTITVTGQGGGVTRTTSFITTVQAPPFNFSLSNSGNSTVTQGGSTSNTITATLSSGATQAVSYSVSGLPSGATSLFSPTSCSPNCSTTLSITAGASTPAGNYTITVTGTGGGLTRTTTFTLTVNASFNFSLTNGGNKTVTQGSSVTNSVTASLSSGSTQAVSYYAVVSGNPYQVNTSFSPASCSPTCSTVLNITTTSLSPGGSYTVTVTGTGGGVTRTTTFTLTILVPFNFSLSNTGNRIVVQGSSVTNTVTATLSSGSTQAVSYSVSGLPSGATSLFSPTSCSPNCSTTLSITAGASTPAGNYTITVTGTGGGLTRTTTFTLTVQTPQAPFDFSLSNGGNKTVITGSSVINSISATLSSGSTQAVSYSVSGLPSNTTSSFSSLSCSPTCSTTLTIITNTSSPLGNYTITVTGTGGGLTRTTTFTLTIQGGFNFSLSNGGARTITRGGSSITNTVTATLLSGATQAVSYSVSGLPSNTTASISPTSCNPTCSTIITISAGVDGLVGSYTITVTGTGGGLTRTTSFTLTILAGTLDFSLTPEDSSITATKSSSNITVDNRIIATKIFGPSSGIVNFSSFGSLPSGVTASFVPTSSCDFSAYITCYRTMRLTISPSAAVGSYTITARGVGDPGGTTKTSTFTLTIQDSSSSTLSAPANLSVTTPSPIFRGGVVRFEWDSSSGATYYLVAYYPNGVLSSWLVVSSPNTFIDFSNTSSLSSVGARVKACNGVDSCSDLTLYVYANLVSPSCSIDITPSSIVNGESATLSWTSSYTNGGIIDQSIGSVGSNGSRTINPMASTTYTGTFYGQNGQTITCQANVYIVVNASLQLTERPDCPFTQDEGTVVNFGPIRLVSGDPARWGGLANGIANYIDEVASLSPGTYTAKTFSWDAYNERINSGVQIHEQFNVQAYNGGTLLGTAGPTTDLSDNVYVATSLDTFTDAFTITGSADKIRAIHAFIDLASPEANSVVPICAVFKKKEEFTVNPCAAFPTFILNQENFAIAYITQIIGLDVDLVNSSGVVDNSNVWGVIGENRFNDLIFQVSTGQTRYMQLLGTDSGASCSLYKFRNFPYYDEGRPSE